MDNPAVGAGVAQPTQAGAILLVAGIAQVPEQVPVLAQVPEHPLQNYPEGPVAEKAQRLQKCKNVRTWKKVYTSRFWTGEPKSCNPHIYHVHISKSLNLDFFKFVGPGGGLIN
jgi:hypothetical protein